MIPTLAQYNPIFVTALVVVFLLVCIAMILLILIQRPQGGGLSGAFGAGGGAGQTAFGTKTGDVLTIVTITIFVLFLLTAIVLNFAARPQVAPAPGTSAAGINDTLPAEVVEEEGAADQNEPPVTDIDDGPVGDPGMDNESSSPALETEPEDGGTP